MHGPDAAVKPEPGLVARHAVWVRLKAHLASRRGRHPPCLVVTPAAGGVCALRLAPGAQRPRLELLRWQAGAALANLAEVVEAWRLPRMPVAALLPAGGYLTFVEPTPQLPPGEIEQALLWQLRDRLPYPATEAVLAHLPLPPRLGQSYSWVVVARRDEVAALAQTYTQARLPLQVLDVEECAQRNLAWRLGGADTTVALLHLGEEDALLTVSLGGELLLSRRLPWADAAPDYDHFALDVQRSLDYVERHQQAIAARLLLAPASGQEEVARRLAERLTLPVTPVRLEDHLDLAGHEALEVSDLQRRLWFALGLAMRWM